MKKETIMRFKRATAAGLVSAILALGTSCGYKPEHTTNSTQPSQTTQTSQTTETTQTTQTTGVPYVEVDPEVDATVIGKENTLSLINLSNTVRQMINDDSAFGNNFSYRAESVLVTGISVTDYVEEEEDANEGVQQDETPKKSLVTISYTADAVDKTTGEKANISDTISYVTQNQEVNKLSNKAFSLSEVDAFSTALIEANQEKIAEAQETTPSGDTTIKTDPADAIKSTTTVADQNQQNDIVQYVIDNYLKEALQNAIDSSQYVQELIGLGYNIEKVHFVGDCTDFHSIFRRTACSDDAVAGTHLAQDHYFYSLRTPYFYISFNHTAYTFFFPVYEDDAKKEHKFTYATYTGTVAAFAIALARNSETNELIAISIPASVDFIIPDDVRANLLSQLGIKDNVDYLNIHKIYDTGDELIKANVDFKKVITQSKTKEELAENAMLVLDVFTNHAEKYIFPLYNLAIDYCNIYDITNHPRKDNFLDIGILRHLTNNNKYSLDFTQPQQEKE